MPTPSLCDRCHAPLSASHLCSDSQPASDAAATPWWVQESPSKAPPPAEPPWWVTPDPACQIDRRPTPPAGAVSRPVALAPGRRWLPLACLVGGLVGLFGAGAYLMVVCL